MMKVIVTGNGDMKVIAKLKGLTAGCENETLYAGISFRQSSEGCASGDPLGCTAVDLAAIPISTCVVSDGTCSISATLPAGAVFNAAGLDTGMELLSFGVRRITSVNGFSAPSGYTFAGGFLLP
jgi:hypothetical protein